jgi:hypothetical protein
MSDKAILGKSNIKEVSKVADSSRREFFIWIR